MNELTIDHYRALLGLDADWRVINVEFLPKAKLVDIRIEYCGTKLSCPECKCSCPRADIGSYQNSPSMAILHLRLFLLAL